MLHFKSINIAHWANLLSRNIAASFVIFFLGLPIGMGAALTSGAPIVAGLVGTAVGGIITGGLGGAPLMVTGPIIGFAPLVLGTIHQYGFAVMCYITILAGVMQVMLSLLRLGRLARHIAPVILHGMLAGVGILVVFAQLHVVLGANPKSSLWGNILALPHAALHANIQSLLLGLTAIAIALLWGRLKIANVLPASLMALIVCSVLTCVCDLDVKRVHVPHQSFQLLSFDLSIFSQHNMLLLHWHELLLTACTIALMGSIYSLLSMIAVDRLHNFKPANLNIGIATQGLGNIASGLLGGIPISGAVLRSTANINAGATSCLSNILHGVWMLLAILLLGDLLRYVPLAALAATFVVLGCQLLSPKLLYMAYKNNTVVTYIVTFIGVVGSNLLVGVACGLLVQYAQQWVFKKR